MSLSERTQQCLSNLISVVAEGEKKTEMVRQVLAEQNLFEPYTAFNRIDQQRTGNIKIQDIVDFMKDNNVIVNQAEALYLFQRLDTNRDGLVTYRDFVSTVLPREDVRLANLAKDRDTYYVDVNMLLPYEIEWALSRVFVQEIRNHKHIVSAQEQLTSKSDFNTLDAFRCIDQAYLGYITLESLNDFTRANGNLLSNDELQAFFRVVDLDQNDRISYVELMEAMTLVPNLTLEFKDELQRGRQYKKELQESRERIDRILNQPQEDKSFELANTKLKNQELQRDLKKSHERELKLKEWLAQSQEVELRKSVLFSDLLKESRDRKLELESANYSRISRIKSGEDRQSIENEERASQLEQLKINQELAEKEILRQQDRLYILTSSRIYEQELAYSQQRVEQLKQIQQDQEQLKQSLERKEIQEELRESRERIEQLEQDMLQSRTESRINNDSRSQSQAHMKQYEQSRLFDKVDDSAKLAQSRLYQTPKKSVPEQNKSSSTPNSYYGLQQSGIKQSGRQSGINQSGVKQSRIQESHMRTNEEANLIQAFKQQISHNQELDEIKTQLAFKPDFHPSVAFSMLDPKERGHFTKLDFELALNDLDLFPTSEQIRLFYSRFSPDSSFFNYKSFLETVLPQSEQYKELMLSRGQEKMNFSTIALFKQLLKKLFQVEESFEELRNRLNKRPFFNVNQAFEILDKDSKGYITQDQFKDFFKKNGVFATNRDIQGLVSVYDKNKDGKVSYQEFITEISPKRPLKL